MVGYCVISRTYCMLKEAVCFPQCYMLKEAVSLFHHVLYVKIGSEFVSPFVICYMLKEALGLFSSVLYVKRDS